MEKCECGKGLNGGECLLVPHVLVSLDAGLGHEIRNGLLQVVNPVDVKEKLFSNFRTSVGRDSPVAHVIDSRDDLLGH